MCKSALDAVNENKFSFAFCRFFCERNNGNDVLLVEGKTDYIFYSRFTKKYNMSYYDAAKLRKSILDKIKKHIE